MNRKEVMLDPRKQEDLCRRVEDLAVSYTPEWRFDRSDPDIGSTLALIYANQMADNIRRINQLPEKYHTEFVNMLGLTLQSAYPASGVVVVDLMPGTVSGVALPRNSRLMAEDGAGMPILFETEGDVYLTNARITDILSISGSQGRIRPILGTLKPARLVQGEETDGEEESPKPMEGVALFDYEEPGIEKNAMLIYHRNVFGTEPEIPVLLRPVAPDGTSLAAELADSSRWRWSYHGSGGLQPFDAVGVQGKTLVLRRDDVSVPLSLDGAEYHLICLEALQPIQKELTLGDIRAASQKEAAPPQAILHNGEMLEPEECMPLGETVSLFDECYICDDQVFGQKGATATLSFRLSNRKKMMLLTAQQEEEELKVIKRKPRAIQYDTALTSPQRIVLEYYNGHAWRSLPCESDWGNLMDGTHSGDFRIVFRCPEDWAAVPVNGYEGRSLRIRVTQADHCYLLPCEHTMPVLRDVCLAYAYEGTWKQPQRLETVCGTMVREQTKALLSGEKVTVFQPLPYPAATLYLGFDAPLTGAPISLLFDVEENVHFHMEPVSFEYSTRTGFKPMKVVDGTENFSRTGTVLFMPPSDFSDTEVEGVRRWWLRLRGEEKAIRGYHALIREIRVNAVEIRNKQTREEESFFAEAVMPNMTFPLAARNVLSAEVFVSERMSRYQMRQMLEEHPEDVRAEYDFMGEITSFYLRWTEVDNFDSSRPGDRHYTIDRVQNTLTFGDGIHVRIPQQGSEILVRPISCDGSRGNVPAGAVNSFFGNIMYVESVRNPAATYAGSDLEDLNSVRRRAADLVSSRGRLISQTDFVRAVKAFSGMVEKTKCMAGFDIDGNPDPSLITIAVMMKDYADGSHSFNSIREPLRRQILARCDATVTPECLILSEPVYVEISVSVWVKADSAARAFEIQNLILDSVRDFLDPMPRPGHSGWEIGSLPSESQLKMLLQSLRFPGHVGRMIAVGRYVDRNGIHEAALDQMPNTPFTIGISGEHKVYIEFQ